MPDLASTAVTLNDISSTFERWSAGNVSARQHLRGLAMHLIMQLETPQETLMRLFTTPVLNASIRVCVQLGVFSALATANDQPVSVDDLASQSSVDTAALLRIMRHLAAAGVVRQVSEKGFASTSLALALTDPGHSGGVVHMFDVLGPASQNLPSWLVENERGFKTAFNAAFATNQGMYDWQLARKDQFDAFNSFMEKVRPRGEELWTGLDAKMLEVDETAAADEAAVVVDVGGGKGHDMVALRAVYPQIGKIVLQDLPDVVAQAGELEGITKLGHNYFSPQPVKGARAYYMHFIMHNRTDDDCVRILDQIKPAMRPGYSNILVVDCVVPEVHAPIRVTGLDVAMMAMLGSRERTAAEWHMLAERAGLIITGMTPMGGLEDVIVFSLPSSA